MRATRIINRTLIGIGFAIALLVMGDDMDSLNIAQFITAKLLTCVFAYSLWRIAMDLNKRNKI